MIHSTYNLKPIFHKKTGWRRVEFASPTQKSSLKSTWPTPGRTQNCRREVYSTGLASGKFRVTSAGVGAWRRIENEADPIQDGGGRTQTTWVGDRYDAPGGLLRPGGRCYRPQEEKWVYSTWQWTPDACFLRRLGHPTRDFCVTDTNMLVSRTRRQSHPTRESPDAKVTRCQIVGGPDASHLPIFQGIFLRVGGQNWRFFLALGVTRVR